MKYIVLCLLTATLLPPPLGAEHPGQWIPLTTDTARVGSRFILADPFRPDVLYADEGNSFPSALLISSDAGRSWRRVSFGTQNVHEVAVTREPVPTLYVRTSSTGGGTPRSYLQQSRDGGTVWTETEIESPLSGGESSLAADGQNGDVVYVGLDRCSGSCTGGVLRSLNGGRDWSVTALQNKSVSTLTADPSVSGVVYATESGDPYASLYRSVNTGATWTKLSLISAQRSIPIQFDPSASSTIFAVVQEGAGKKLMRSDDRGDGWTAIHSAVSFASEHALAVDPANRARIVYSFGSTALISNDGGATWSDISRGLLFTTNGELYAGTYLGIMTFTEPLPRRRSVRH